MQYMYFQQQLVLGDVLYVDTVPDCEDVNWVELSADGGPIRYTLGGTTWPEVPGVGMILHETRPPKRFHIEDFKTLRFCSGGKMSRLLMHFGGGRDVVSGIGAFSVTIGTVIAP